MSLSKSKNILIVMTGSIACYKACHVISQLKQKGHSLKIVMSPRSLDFIGRATVEGLTGEAPITDMYAQGSVMDHINLIRWADLVLAAPATANYINKIAYGIGDDLLTTLFLAHNFDKPFLIAPAMNTKMYLHPTTQESIKRLRDMKVEILETASGVLACGEIGTGRLLEPDLLIKEVETRLALPPVMDKVNISQASLSSLAPQEARILHDGFKPGSVLITAGGTAEPIDDVRVITNKSTGRTAAQLADHLTEMGWTVTFLHSSHSALPKLTCQQIPYTTFADLSAKLTTELTSQSYVSVIHAAAVSDYSPIPVAGKFNSDAVEIQLTLKRNPKLINEIKKLSPNSLLIGFKLTSNASEETVVQKVNHLFEHAFCDYVIQNDWSQSREAVPKYRFYSRALQQKVDLHFEVAESPEILHMLITKALLQKENL